MSFLSDQPYGVKVAVVVVFGSLAFALMIFSEFSRQSYELSVCTSNSTGVDVCVFNSANASPMLAEASVAVASMALAAAAANTFAPPTLSHMRRAFVSHHFIGVCVWYSLSWIITLVPLCYTIYLLSIQGSNSGANLSVSDPATENQSQLLVSLDGPPAYNSCNPNNIYCLSIVPGLLAGFGYLFAGATAFWSGWVVMDDTAYKVLRNEDVDDGNGVEGAYFSAAKQGEPLEPITDGSHIAAMR